MKTVLGRIVGAAVALVVTMGAASAAQVNYRVVSFGDSLSDVGNLFDQAGQPPAPYYKGRFSNGPVWTELFARNAMQKFAAVSVNNAKDTNYAFGGAYAGSGGQVPTIGQQIGAYVQKGGSFAAGDVATVLGGANDLLDLTAGSSKTTIRATAVKAADAQAANVRALIKAGAKIIVVPNLPPLNRTPRATATTGLAAVFALATTTFNTRLAADLKGIQATNKTVRIVAFDLNGLFNAVVANPTMFGFSDVKHPCITDAACVSATRAVQNEHLFWDDIHPTNHAHQFVAFMVRWDLEH